MTEPRPKIDDAMKFEAAKVVAQKVGGDPETIAGQYVHPMDGFELAKNLDRYCSWDTTREDMEALDEMSTLVSSALRQAEKEWFERNSIRPPLAIGTRVKWRGGVGEITGIYEHGHAKYLIKPIEPTIGDRRYIVNFEDVAAEEIAPA